MMIHLHVALADVGLFKRRVKLKAREGAAAEEVLELCMEKYKAAGTLCSMRGISILINGARGSFKQELRDGDRVKVFRPVSRG